MKLVVSLARRSEKTVLTLLYRDPLNFLLIVDSLLPKTSDKTKQAARQVVLFKKIFLCCGVPQSC